MKIVVLAPVHIYDDIRVFRKESVTLAEAGNEVVLYARTPDDQPVIRSGVNVRPVRRRSRPGRFVHLPVLCLQAVREKADVYHLHNPDTLPIGFLLRALRRHVVYDTHEDFRSEILLRQWLPRLLRRAAADAVAGMEAVAGKWFDAVIVTQSQLLDRIPAAVVIGNPPVVDSSRAMRLAAERTQRLRSRSGEPLVLGYVGGISADRGLFRMLDLLRELQESGPTRLILVGPPVNDDALEVARARPEWRWVDYRGVQTQEDAFGSLDEAHVGLILFEDTASHRFLDPNKIYEYLALALPFVATGFDSWRDRFRGSEVGLFLDPDSEATERAVSVRRFTNDRSRLADVGRKGVEFVVEKYSWENNGAPALLKLYERFDRSGDTQTVSVSRATRSRLIRRP